MDVALYTISRGIVLPAASTSRRPRSIDRTESTNTPNVVVLIPPPVEPGDAPMNMRMINSS